MVKNTVLWQQVNEECGKELSNLFSFPMCRRIYIQTGNRQMSNRTLITCRYFQVSVQAALEHLYGGPPENDARASKGFGVANYSVSFS